MSIAPVLACEARATYELHDALGRVLASGEGAALVGEAHLAIGPVTIGLLDVEAVSADERIVSLALWPSGRLVLSGLGDRHAAFVAALVAARTEVRLEGLLADGPDTPSVYFGTLRSAGEPGERGGAAGPQRAELRLYQTHLAVLPERGDPFQLPFGALAALGHDGPGAARCTAFGRTVVLDDLGRQGDTFVRELEARRGGLARLLAEAAGTPALADGAAVPRSELPQFERLLADFTAPERVEHVGLVLAAAAAHGGEPRFGLVMLQDLEGETLASPVPLPARVAPFLLVPVGPRVVLEMLSGPSAATYVFEGEPGAIGRDLQAIHFRRAPLAVVDDEAVRAEHPYRLAFRALPPLIRLRDATRERIIHDGNWRDCFEVGIGSAPAHRSS